MSATIPARNFVQGFVFRPRIPVRTRTSTFSVWGPKLAHTSDQTCIGGCIGSKEASFSGILPGCQLLSSRQEFFDPKLHQNQKTKKKLLFWTLLSNVYNSPPLPKRKLPRLPRPRVAKHMFAVVGKTHGAPGSPHPPTPGPARLARYTSIANVVGQPRSRSHRSGSLIKVMVNGTVMASSQLVLYS